MSTNSQITIETEALEERLKSLVEQLKAECGIFERIVYKNKNQHRRSSYFQYLLKVRRDMRLLQSVKLEEILGCCFLVITGKKPKQKLYLLESLKWRKRDHSVHNFMERLTGAARLLSQMVEPMMKAATEISILFARSFFMGFSLTVLALLARLRVLVQQILLDVVCAFNMVSSISQMKQSVKITQEGIEIFRDYYPADKEFVTLECAWNVDKFVLLERTQKSNEVLADASVKTSAVQYESIESFLGVQDDSDIKNMSEDNIAKEGSIVNQEGKKNLSMESGSSKEDDDAGTEAGDDLVYLGAQDKKLPPEGVLLATTSSSPSSNFLSQVSSTKHSVKRPAPSAAAFISVKRSATSTSSIISPHSEEAEKDSSKENSFFDLLTGGRSKDRLF